MSEQENDPRPQTDPGKTDHRKIRIRRLIERKMVESWQSKPHFFVTIAVDMTDVIRFRKDLGVTINDFVLAATTAALKEHPWVNSHWVDGEAVEQASINLAMAVATEGGLYYPVIKGAGQMSLKQLSESADVLAEKAHLGQLDEEEQEGGTFTVTNMGMLGVESFAAIVTPPQAAVLAVGTVKGEVVVDEHEELVVAPMVRLTLSSDHRILDGADAAEFLDSLKSYLEAPVTLIAGTCFDDV
jgi:pyruvate dehydrogenase E2 component (dihydrolipoamide acetyltransferase)